MQIINASIRTEYVNYLLYGACVEVRISSVWLMEAQVCAENYINITDYNSAI